MDKIFGTDTSYFDEDDDDVSDLYKDRILDDRASLFSRDTKNSRDTKQRTSVIPTPNLEIQQAQMAAQLMRCPELSQK